MEESQERDSSSPGVENTADWKRESEGTSLGLQRISYAKFVANEAVDASRLLGGVAYGARAPAGAGAAQPIVWVPLPAVGGDSFVELWTSEEPVVRSDADGIVGAHDRQHLFGAIQLEEQDSLEALAESAYARVFDYVDGLGFPHLLRTWNYFPGINTESGGIERYRQFNSGRHAAFAAKQRVIGENTSAASALGSRSGPLIVFFIAGNEAGQPIENPRQVSAYRYPDQYGARSPAFSRAMLVDSGGARTYFISGTASIVGHETLHVNDVTAQIHETIANLRAVLNEGMSRGLTIDDAGMFLKAYVRRREHAATVREALGQAFAGSDIVCVRADVCRVDLLVEVEAVVFEAA